MEDDSHYTLIFNDKGYLIFISPNASRVLGYAPDELIGQSLAKISPESSPKFWGRFFGLKSVLKNDNYFIINSKHLSKTGLSFPVRVYFKLSENIQGEKNIIALVEFKKNEESLKFESSYSYNHCDFYFDIDKYGIAEAISPSAEKLFGFTEEFCVGLNYFDGLPVEERQEAKKTFQHFATKNLPYRSIFNFGQDLKRQPINVEMYFAPNINEMGNFVGYRVLGWLQKNLE